MNAKLLLVAALGGFLFFSKNKPKSKTPVKENEDLEEEDVEKEEEETEDEPPAVKETPTYKTLTPARKKIIDEYLKIMPTLTSELGPYNDYIEWSKIQQESNTKPLYQNFLTTNIYHHISVLEGKTDVFTKFGEQPVDQYDGSLPYILQRGIKGQIAEGGPWVELIPFDEFQAEATKRLGKGIALWSDIKKYIDSNIDLNSCPVGVVCK